MPAELHGGCVGAGQRRLTAGFGLRMTERQNLCGQAPDKNIVLSHVFLFQLDT